MEAKLMVYQFLTEFTFDVCEKTSPKIEFGSAISPALANPLYLEFKPRVK